MTDEHQMKYPSIAKPACFGAGPMAAFIDVPRAAARDVEGCVAAGCAREVRGRRTVVSRRKRSAGLVRSAQQRVLPRHGRQEHPRCKVASEGNSFLVTTSRSIKLSSQRRSIFKWSESVA